MSRFERSQRRPIFNAIFRDSRTRKKLESEAKTNSVLHQIANMFGPACPAKTSTSATKDEVMDIARNLLEMF